MKSVQYFIIEPVDGKRYDNTININGVDLVMSATVEDHKVSQRFAVVKEVPVLYNGYIKPGDIVVVHHNVFKMYYDINGKLKSSWNHVSENTFICEVDQIYLYKRDGEWKVPYPFCFIKPINKLDSFFEVDSKYESLIGEVTFYPTDDLKSGDIVAFRPDSEYEFKIDDVVLYRMRIKDLCLQI